MHITTEFVSSNTAHGKVYAIKSYVIKFVSDLRLVGSFLPVLRVPPPIKQNDLILFKVALNTITLILEKMNSFVKALETV